MNYKKNISKVMSILEKHYHHEERTTLNRMRKKPDAFKILIACLLSLRAKDEVTEKISEGLFKVADAPEKIVELPTKRLEKIIFSSGHYHKKAQTLKSVSKDLIKRFDSKVPSTKEELMSIKGIGQKTSNLVLSFAFNKKFIPIDTHCHRIPNRLSWVKTKNADQTEVEIIKILPEKYWQEFNGIFVLFGKTICQPISPFCSKCPISKYCPKTGVKKSR